MSGGNKNKRNRGPLPREVQVSKKLSWLLRHGAESEKLSLTPDGYARLDAVLANRNLRSLKVTFDEICEIVADNDKQRFTLKPAASPEQPAPDLEAEGKAETPSRTPLPSSDPHDWLIRANQGHSIQLDSAAGLLEPIDADAEDEIPAVAVHGTTHAAWPRILASGGLKPMGRNHVHFASGLPAGFQRVKAGEGADGEISGEAKPPPPVISGMRTSSTILVFVDVRKAMTAGMKFWRSDNGVILTEGNAEGVVPVEVFERVEDRTGEGVLVEAGRVLRECPERWGKGKSKS